MKTIFTGILAMLLAGSLINAQDTLYIYKGGAVVNMRAVADVDSLTFYKTGSTVTDIDGNVYKTVKIGSQVWMAENLKTRQYNDGTAIPLVKDSAAWIALSTPGYCWYNNDSAIYNATYGVLYNWYTVNTGKLCPAGWHVPTHAEWTVLTDYLGGEEIAGGKLKEAGFAHWADPNTGATNETGFTALPGGGRYSIGPFGFIGLVGGWWSSDEYDLNIAWSHIMSNDKSSVDNYDCYKQLGWPVRCLKDD